MNMTSIKYVDGYPVGVSLRWRHLFAKIQSPTGTTRTCRKCGLIKPIEAFHHTQNNSLGRRTVCGHCRNQVNVA
jgi:transposase